MLYMTSSWEVPLDRMVRECKAEAEGQKEDSHTKISGTAVTRHHKLGGLEQQNLLSLSSKVQKSKINMAAGPYFLWRL